MTPAQLIILGILGSAMLLFLWGRWRHDLVAMAALLACVVAGLVPSEEAFAGFGHPAVITVACVLILSHGLQMSGAVDALASRVLPGDAGPGTSVFALITLAAVLSGFMNNVGALALMMPVAIQTAARQGMPAGRLLMPLAFGSILGGMTTLIGTPPNLIVAGFRAETGVGGFSMFDFTPVGVVVALIGVVFIGLLGWRLVPTRRKPDGESFEFGTYLSEVRVASGSRAAGRSLREVEALMEASDAQVVGMVRSDVRLSAPNPNRVLQEGDVLVVEVDPESLSSVLSELGLELEEAVAPEEADADGARHGGDTASRAADGSASDTAGEEEEEPVSEEVIIQELVVLPSAAIVSRSATDLDLRARFGINLLALSRQGRRTIRRLRSTPVQAGDVLLMQGAPEALAGFAGQFGCLPLAAREFRVPSRALALRAVLIMAAAVVATGTGVLPAAVAFAGGALAFVATGIVPLRSVYTSIDWPVIVLLAAMIPVAGAMDATGTADLIAGVLLANVVGGEAIAGLVVLMVVAMFLSDLMNNAATAAVMCPIALSAASHLGVNADAFLMAIAVGASCAFLTPIGHQNNTLILGPGGFRFGDYWRLGLPLECLVVAVATPMILWVWPL